jgi:hypothetical protein
MTDRDAMTDKMKTENPPLTLLCKLGSLAVHVDEALSDDSHLYDWTVIHMLLDDPEVKQWIIDMGPLLPKKRK